MGEDLEDSCRVPEENLFFEIFRVAGNTVIYEVFKFLLQNRVRITACCNFVVGLNHFFDEVPGFQELLLPCGPHLL